MLYSGALVDEQVQDFDLNVAPHLNSLPEQDSSVDPREIKRHINAHVLQVKMLSLRLESGVNRAIVLACKS